MKRLLTRLIRSMWDVDSLSRNSIEENLWLIGMVSSLIKLTGTPQKLGKDSAPRDSVSGRVQFLCWNHLVCLNNEPSHRNQSRYDSDMF